MPAQVYKDMLEVMAKRGGPYSGADIPEFYPLMEELFTPEEAQKAIQALNGASLDGRAVTEAEYQAASTFDFEIASEGETKNES